MSDFGLGISGLEPIRRWWVVRTRLESASAILRAKHRAEALADVGYILHGRMISGLSEQKGANNCRLLHHVHGTDLRTSHV